MSIDGATIKVVNWDKYNPRTDSKRPTWFRLENDIATGPGFFGLDCEQKWLWVFILSLVSQNNGEPIEWNSAYCTQLTGISEDKQEQTFRIFEKFVRLRVSRKVTSEPSHATRRDETDETDETRRDGRDEPLANAASDAQQSFPMELEEAGKGEKPPRKPRKPRKPKEPAKTTAAWEAYREAYRDRYGEYPVRNKRVNSQLSAMIERLGVDEAPRIAAFYVTHNDSFYVNAMHPTNLLLRDCEKLRTEWATGQRMLGSKAREIEKTQHNYDTWDRAGQIVESAGAPCGQ